MIQLQTLSGTSAGKRFSARDFPYAVGRDSRCAAQLSDAGVFDRHFEIRFSSDGYFLAPAENAVVTINGERTAGGILRNGDIVGAGYAKLQFWLAVLPQRGLRLREILVWIVVSGMTCAQVYLLISLLRLARE